MKKSKFMLAFIMVVMISTLAWSDYFLDPEFNRAIGELNYAESVYKTLKISLKNGKIIWNQNQDMDIKQNPFIYFLKAKDFSDNEDPNYKAFLIEAYKYAKDNLGEIWLLRDLSLKMGVRNIEVDNLKIDFNDAIMEAVYNNGSTENIPLALYSCTKSLQYYDSRQYLNARYEAELAVQLAPTNNEPLEVMIKINDYKLKSNNISGNKFFIRVTIFFENLRYRMQMLHNLLVDFLGQIYLISNLVLFLYFVVFYTVIYLLIFIIIKYLQVIYQQLVNKFTIIYPNQKLVSLFILILIFTPFFFNKGFMFVFFVYLAITLIYFKKIEKLITLLLLILLFTSNLYIEKINILLQPFLPDNAVALVYRSQNSGYSENLISKFKDKKNNFYTNFTLGLLYKRNGNFKLAEQSFQVAETMKEDAKIYNNLGNIYAIWPKNKPEKERMKKAEEYYKKALSLDENLLEAYYNLSTIYTLRHQFDISEEYVQKASKIDINKVSKFSKMVDPKNFNRMYMDATFRNRNLWKFLFEKGEDGKALYEIKSILPFYVVKFNYGKKDFILFGILLIIFIIMFIFFREYVPDHNICTLCYKPLTKDTEKEYMEKAVCAVCYNTLKDLKTSNLIRTVVANIKRHSRNIVMRYKTLISIFLPGAIYIYIGKFKEGITIAILFLVFLFFLLSLFGVPMTYNFMSILNIKSNVFDVVMLILFFFFWFFQYRHTSKYFEKIKKDVFNLRERSN